MKSVRTRLISILFCAILLAFVFLRGGTKLVESPTSKMQASQIDLFELPLTNGWSLENVCGGTRTGLGGPLTGRSRTDFFSKRNGDTVLLRELLATVKLQGLDRARRDFFFEDYHPSESQISDPVAAIAPWWLVSESGPCTYVEFSADKANKRGVIRIYAFIKGTNVSLYTHITTSSD